jgi:copper chaperone CopZ
MKKSILLGFLIVAFGMTSFSQTKSVISSVIKTPTVQCESCKKKIEENLKRVDGIQKVNVDFKKKTTKVTFLSDRTNIEYIKTAIANSGYDADDVVAIKEAYQKLPTCCKKPEDGGGN